MSNLLDALWVDYLDGDAETDAEAKLFAAARADSGLASAWAKDQAFDCSLRSHEHLAETEDKFVADWERRLQESADREQELAEPPCAAPHCAALPYTALPYTALPYTAPPDAEPPIAEPPAARPHVSSEHVSSVYVFGSARRLTVEHRASRNPLQAQSTAVLVACVALLTLVAVSFWIFRGNGNVARQETPPPQDPPVIPVIPAQEKNPDVEPQFRFVLPKPQTNRPQVNSVVWQTGGPQNNRLPPGEHRLRSGLVELVSGTATPVTIKGPASVKVGDDDTWFVERGTIAVSDPASGERLPIVTPNSRIRSQGAEFVVSVDDAGQTDLQVRRGEVHLLSGAEGESGPPLKLLAGEFERAQLSPPGNETGDAPAFCQLQGPENRFCGLIQLDGKTLRFATPEEFLEFQKQVEEQFVKDAEELRQKWPELVQVLGGIGGGEIQLERDGKPQEIQTLAQLLEFLDQLPVPPGIELKPGVPGLPKIDLPKAGLPKTGLPKLPLPVPAEGDGEFQGTIIINGQEHKFKSLQEFNAARKKLLEQLGPLGPIQLPGLDDFDIPLP